MSSVSFSSVAARFCSVATGLLFAGVVALSALPVRGEAPVVEEAAPVEEMPHIDRSAHPDVAETCAAMFVLMAYAHADDDPKERQFEEKKALAMTDIQPVQDAALGEAKSVEERIQTRIDILTDMLVEKPAGARAMVRECFRQYPPEIELN